MYWIIMIIQYIYTWAMAMREWNDKGMIMMYSDELTEEWICWMINPFPLIV